jgi:hypothetical protein
MTKHVNVHNAIDLEMISSGATQFENHIVLEFWFFGMI